MIGSRWPTVALGEVLSLALAPERVEPERSYPALGVYGFGRGVITDKLPVRGSDIAAPVLFKVKAGQFIYSKLKAFEGAFAVVPDEADGRFVTNEFPTFDCHAERLDNGYLAWLFRLPATWAKLSEESTGIGARRERVHPEQVLRFRCMLPPLPIQRSIARCLDSVAERIAKRAAAAKKVEVELGTMLQAAFRRMTSGAPVVRLGDVAPLVRRNVTVHAERIYTEIGVRSFFRGTFHRRSVSGAEFTWQDLFTVHEGDLVFSNLMAWEGAVAVAGAEDCGCVGNHRMLTCEVDPSRAVPRFLLFHFRQPAGSAQLIASSPGSIARNRTLGPAALADLRVPLPSLDVQKEFDTLHAKAQDALAAQQNATQELDKLLPALLHEAFGEDTAALPRAAA